MRDQARVWDRLSKRYIKSPISNIEAYEHKLAVTQSYMRPDMDVLEIGCGSGNTARKHAPFVGQYTAMDISGKMLAEARAQGPVPDNLTFVHANFDQTDIAPESYDMVLALSLLHLVPSPPAMIAKIFRTLRPGGVFVSSTAMVGEMAALKYIAPVGQLFGVIPHLSMLKPEPFRDMLRDAGFVIDVDEQPGDSGVLFIVARRPA